MTITHKMTRFNNLAFLPDVADVAIFTIGWDQIKTETDDVNALVTDWTSIFSLTTQTDCRKACM